MVDSVEHTKRLVIVGLPEVGKTSFIQAVDEVLQDPPNAQAFRSYKLAADRTALETLKGKFRGGLPVGRTERLNAAAPPELFFEDPVSGRKGHLVIPDLDGEVFTDQWRYRVCDEAYPLSLKTADGLLLFVRADLPSRNEELIGELLSFLGAQGAPIKPWDLKNASAQVQLVDVLQFIADFRVGQAPLRTAVVVSAWDVVLSPTYPGKPTPDGFLATEWALLDQFLRTNQESFDSRVFGVSALGGDLKAQEQLAKLPLRRRVKVAFGADLSDDATQPLRWLLDVE